MTLPTRRLGSSGPHITTVGFGAWAVGGGGWAFGWGPQDDDASIAAMLRAIELGVNWIDTAAVYGLGHSEWVVGRLLEQLPQADRPFVFTKGGQVWDDQDRLGKPVVLDVLGQLRQAVIVEHREDLGVLVSLHRATSSPFRTRSSILGVGGGASAV